MKIKLLFVACSIAFASCSKVDDYMLGKDNTPKPKKLSTLKNNLPVKQQWSTSVGKSASTEYLRLKPILENTIIYTANANGMVDAVNTSGQVVWTNQLKDTLVSGPALGNNFLVVSTDRSNLVVLNKSTGKTLWSAKLSAEILAQPAITRDKIIAKSIDGKVTAFSSRTGKELWSYDHGTSGLVLKASSSPIIYQNKLLVGFSDGKIDALDINNGRLLWQRSLTFASGSSEVETLIDIGADPIVENNVAYLASYQGSIAALSLENGEFLWQTNASVYKNVVMNGNSLFYSDSNDILWSLDKRNGKVNWKNSSFKARGITEPSFSQGNLVIGDKTGYMHLVNAQNGMTIARYKLNSGISYTPLFNNNRVYILTDNGMLNKIKIG